MGDSNKVRPDQRGWAVTGLAVANFVLGAGRVTLSVLLLSMTRNFLGAQVEPVGPTAGPQPGSPTDAFLALLYALGTVLFAAVMAALVVVLVVVAVLFILAGVLLLVAGVGLLKRRPWARILTLILGGVGGALALLYAAQGVYALQSGSSPEGLGLSLAGLALHGGYCAATYAILLNKGVRAEFA